MNSSTALPATDIEAFVTRWRGSTASELSTAQSFMHCFAHRLRYFVRIQNSFAIDIARSTPNGLNQ